MKDKEHYAAVLPDGREYCETTTLGPDRVAQNAVRHFRLTTPRPQDGPGRGLPPVYRREDAPDGPREGE